MNAADATFPKLLTGHAHANGTRAALQEKRYGIWQTITWAEYDRRVRRFAQGLASLGFAPGDVLAILGDNRPEWVIAELAAQAVGGMSVGLYPDGVVEEVDHVVNHAGVRFAVAEDQEQVEMLLEFPEVERLGKEFEGAHPGWIDEQIERGASADVAILCTTSGTTSKP